MHDTGFTVKNLRQSWKIDYFSECQRPAVLTETAHFEYRLNLESGLIKSRSYLTIWYGRPCPPVNWATCALTLNLYFVRWNSHEFATPAIDPGKWSAINLTYPALRYSQGPLLA